LRNSFYLYRSWSRLPHSAEKSPAQLEKYTGSVIFSQGKKINVRCRQQPFPKAECTNKHPHRRYRKRDRYGVVGRCRKTHVMRYPNEPEFFVVVSELLVIKWWCVCWIGNFKHIWRSIAIWEEDINRSLMIKLNLHTGSNTQVGSRFAFSLEFIECSRELHSSTEKKPYLVIESSMSLSSLDTVSLVLPMLADLKRKCNKLFVHFGPNFFAPRKTVVTIMDLNDFAFCFSFPHIFKQRWKQKKRYWNGAVIILFMLRIGMGKNNIHKPL